MRTLLFVAALSLAACHTEASAPKQPPLPEGVEVADGKQLFELDTTTTHVAGVVHGDGAALDAELASPGGQRAIHFSGSGFASVTIAAGGWNLPPVAAVAKAGDALVCWNHLTGAEDPAGTMPHPTRGLALVCRQLTATGASPEIVVPSDAPLWLQDVVASGGGYVVTYLRNKDGWLVTPAQQGDGVFTRTFDGKAFGEPVPATP